MGIIKHHDLKARISFSEIKVLGWCALYVVVMKQKYPTFGDLYFKLAVLVPIPACRTELVSRIVHISKRRGRTTGTKRKRGG